MSQHWTFVDRLMVEATIPYIPSSMWESMWESESGTLIQALFADDFPEEGEERKYHDQKAISRLLVRKPQFQLRLDDYLEYMGCGTKRDIKKEDTEKLLSTLKKVELSVWRRVNRNKTHFYWKQEFERTQFYYNNEVAWEFIKNEKHEPLEDTEEPPPPEHSFQTKPKIISQLPETEPVYHYHYIPGSSTAASVDSQTSQIPESSPYARTTYPHYLPTQTYTGQIPTGESSMWVPPPPIDPQPQFFYQDPSWQDTASGIGNQTQNFQGYAPSGSDDVALTQGLDNISLTTPTTQADGPSSAFGGTSSYPQVNKPQLGYETIGEGEYEDFRWQPVVPGESTPYYLKTREVNLNDPKRDPFSVESLNWMSIDGNERYVETIRVYKGDKEHGIDERDLRDRKDAARQSLRPSGKDKRSSQGDHGKHRKRGKR